MKNFQRTVWLSFLMAVFLPALAGCPRDTEFSASEIQVFRSGSLHVPDNDDAPKLIYVDVRDMDGKELLPSSEIKQAFASGNFKIADAPSNAGYILHVSILQKGGVDQSIFQGLVDSGYGSEAKFSGSGSAAILADALLVQRRVPRERRPSRTRLKNITSRNALGSAQMRIGLLVPHPMPEGQPVAYFFGKELAHELRRQLTPNKDEAASTP